jgi:DNA-binding transcriptional MerR regulator
MEKAEGAFLTISELAGELGLPQHILRYWETRFPQLRPLQRSGNRRYYRPTDVALARRIHQLLNVEGFTVKGAQKALVDGNGHAPAIPLAKAAPSDPPDLLARLMAIRTALAKAIGD